MCILYRGEGSLPRDRAGVYEQCADLLFRRWDARRRIHQELRAGHLVEPVLRSVAWSLSPGMRPSRPCESVTLSTTPPGFCRAGASNPRTTPDPQPGRSSSSAGAGCGCLRTRAPTRAAARVPRLYAFTHRTFLEYFAASQLAFSKDSPERSPPRSCRTSCAASPGLSPNWRCRSRTGPATAAHPHLRRPAGRAPRPLAGHAAVPCSMPAIGRSSPQFVRELTRQLFTATREAERDISPDSSLPSAWRELPRTEGTTTLSGGRSTRP